jgi:hypothetical protein
MFNHLNELEGVSIHFNHEVRTLKEKIRRGVLKFDLATGQNLLSLYL